MVCVREVIDPGKLKEIIRLPEEMVKSKVEVIVLPIDEPVTTNSKLKKQLQAIEELNGLIADQGQEKLAEFDKIISQRIALREVPVEL